MRGLHSAKRSLLTLAMMVSACSDGGAPPAPLPGDDGDDERMDATVRDARVAEGGADGGEAGADGGEAGAGDASLSALGPLMKVLSPVSTEDPDSANVVVGASMKVICQALRNPAGELVNPGSVKVNLYEDGKSKVLITQVATSTTTAGVFEADVSLKDIPHGKVRVECVASDTSTTPLTAAVDITALYDKGPEITFLSPAGGYVAAGTDSGEDVRVRFKVAPRALGTSVDVGATVKSIAVTVGGKAIPAPSRSTTEDDVYSFGVDFNDTALFSVVPDTLNVRVNAETGRLTGTNAAVATLSVGVDSVGPVITVRAPARVGGLDPVVSGKVDVVLEVTDALAGVEPTSVELRIEKLEGGKQAYPTSLGTTAGQFVASFDTGSFPGLPSLAVTLVARDKVGIETQSNLSIDIDTVAPWISLDPYPVREIANVSGTDQCSGAFDPLGDAVNEGVPAVDPVSGLPAQGYRPRALIWDRPLTIAGVPNVRHAMINTSTARLYIQHNTDVPLLIDSDNDPNHECDRIELSTGNTDKAPVTLLLSPILPQGTAFPAGSWQGPNFVLDFDSAPSARSPSTNQPICTSISPTFPGPAPLTGTTVPQGNPNVMSRIIRHTATGALPVVYAYSPVAAANDPSLTGKYYPVPRAGWACLVAVAEDNARNFAFSEPMRVCTEYGGAAACGPVPPSLTCTDGCVIPERFKRSAAGMPSFLRYAL